jgi:protein-S-isoprenylcysteine O-methyltransferase Ste14
MCPLVFRITEVRCIMSAIPAFEIGIWNAWILILGLGLVNYGLGFLIAKKSMLSTWPPYNQTEKKLLGILMLDFMAPWVYSIFLPLKLGTSWFYAGILIYLLGIIFLTSAVVNHAITPGDKPVTKGPYRISRHPINLSWFLVYIGIGIACASWIFLLCGVVYIIVGQILAVAEERYCLEKYGDAYRDYMNRTPRWLGLPKS